MASQKMGAALWVTQILFCSCGNDGDVYTCTKPFEREGNQKATTDASRSHDRWDILITKRAWSKLVDFHVTQSRQVGTANASHCLPVACAREVLYYSRPLLFYSFPCTYLMGTCSNSLRHWARFPFQSGPQHLSSPYSSTLLRVLDHAF